MIYLLVTLAVSSFEEKSQNLALETTHYSMSICPL